MEVTSILFRDMKLITERTPKRYLWEKKTVERGWMEDCCFL